MNVERLLKTAELLEHLEERFPTNTFDIRCWLTECGTVGCAVGHAALDPWHQAQGLKMHMGCDVSDTWPVYNGTQGLCATMEFYGLKQDQALYLFHGSEYAQYYSEVTAMDVATRIRGFVAAHLAEGIQEQAKDEQPKETVLV